MEDAGITPIQTPFQAPNANAFAERFVLSIKSECLRRMIFFGEASLRRAVSEFVAHYHVERAHQGLANKRIEQRGPVGDGEGMVVKRGFPQPTSYHADRLRQSPPGYFYHVITNGFGRMASYADQLEPRDRWAVAAYIRALQFSQNARLSDVPAEKRGEL